MLLRTVVLILLFFSCSDLSFAQDVWLQNHFSPASACSAGSQNVNVLINNNSGVVMPSNSISVFYTVDGGSLTTQNVPANLFPGASFNFNFSTQANVSACGQHVIKVWVSRPRDVNHLNDTLQWSIQNDCPIVPGSVTSNSTVCSGANSGTLTLTGSSNGTITNWETSINGGSTWIPFANTASSFSYSNVNTTTQYRVNIDGGFCPDAFSGTATLTVQAQPVPGTISGSDSVCETNATGSLTLSGNSTGVIQWESSADNGLSWNTIANLTSALNYVSLTQPALFRALTDGGVCANVYSDTAIIYVDNVVPQPALTGSDSLCITNASGIITAPPGLQDILAWEFSTDNGLTWNNIANTTGSQNYANLTQTTLYRLAADGGFCPDVISDTAIVFVQPIYTIPTLGNSDTLCSNAVSGNLNLSGNQSTVLSWESSVNQGAAWNTIANTTTTFNYAGQTQTSLYRVLLDGDFCPDYYSNIAVIALDNPPVPGTLAQDSEVCMNSAVDLTLSGFTADSLSWEYSENGTTWITIANSDNDTISTGQLTQNLQYRVVSFAGVCLPEFSNFVSVNVLPLPQVSAGQDTSIVLGESVQLLGSGGTGGIWMPGETLSDSMIVNPIAAPESTTIYTYTVIDINGCINFADVLLTVTDPTLFEIRNLVTTNNDGFNDTWNISGIEFFPMTDVKVFNQYGQVVFENSDYKNEWKGEWQGKMLPNGTYYYRVLKGGTAQEYKGTLTLLGNE